MEYNKGLGDWQNYMFAIRSYSENILSISWPFVISSFSCILLSMVLGILFVNRGRRYRGSLNLGYVPEQISVLKAQKLIPEDVKEDLNSITDILEDLTPLNATSSSFTRRRIKVKVKQAHFYFFLASYLFIIISVQLLSHWIRDNNSSENINRYTLMPQYFFLFYSKRGDRKSHCNENTVQY